MSHSLDARASHLTFRLEGQPVPKGSVVALGGGRIRPAAKGYATWQRAAMLTLRSQHTQQNRITPVKHQPVSVAAVFHVTRPKTVKRSHATVPPDLDKLQRAVGDLLAQSGVLPDDAQIISWCTRKVYSSGAPYTSLDVTWGDE